MKTLLVMALAICLPSWGLSGRAQTGTDFSGQWVLIATFGDTSAAAQTLVVTQPVTRTTAFGAPTPPAYLTMSVEETDANGTRAETIALGVTTETGAILPDRTAPALRNRVSTRWDQNDLVIERTEYRDVSGAAVAQAERTERWKIDSQGVLNVTRVARDTTGTSVLTMAKYRRSRR